MNNRGQYASIGTLVFMAIVLLLILGVGPMIYKGAKSFFSLFGIGSEDNSQPTKESAAGISFDGFTGIYENCKSYSSSDCLCDQYNTNDLPDGYSIKLERLSSSKTRIGLFGSKPTPEQVKVIENDNICLYNYDKSTKLFSETDVKYLILDKTNLYDYKIDNKVQLFKSNNNKVCFVSGTYPNKQFDEIFRKPNTKKCSLKSENVPPQKIGMLDLGDYTGDYPYESFVQLQTEKASAILSTLRNILIDNVGPTTTITLPTGTTQGRLERRENMFNSAYKDFDANKDGKISDDAYFISVRGLQLQQKNSDIKKDHFKIHYLKGSYWSKALAEKIIVQLRQLDGKLVYGNREVGMAEADEKYRFNIDVIEEENSNTNTGQVFLTCTESYSDFPACKESYYLPAVFIDEVEVDGDGHYMFEGHADMIANRIYEGVKGYLQK